MSVKVQFVLTVFHTVRQSTDDSDSEVKGDTVTGFGYGPRDMTYPGRQPVKSLNSVACLLVKIVHSGSALRKHSLEGRDAVGFRAEVERWKGR
jgi:hypothetical protein